MTQVSSVSIQGSNFVLFSITDWNKMRISISIITQTRPTSLQRLLDSLSNAHYVGDTIGITFNMDSKVRQFQSNRQNFPIAQNGM